MPGKFATKFLIKFPMKFPMKFPIPANGTATQEHSSKPSDPTMTSQFMAYDENYKDGVGLSTGWVAGAEGGAKSIVTSQLAGDGTVKVWSSGSRLDGNPGIYLDNPNHHDESASTPSSTQHPTRRPLRPNRLRRCR